MPLTPFLQSQAFNTSPATARRVPSPIAAGPGSFIVGERAFNPLEEAALSQQRSALQGLREAAGLDREKRSADRESKLFDTLRFGVPEAEAAADVGDVTSEAQAGREFLPMARQLHMRGRGERLEDLTRQFVEPATIRGESELGAAELARQGDVEAAQIGARGGMSRAMLQGLLRAIQESIKSGGGRFDPERVEGLTPDLIMQMFRGGGVQ